MPIYVKILLFGLKNTEKLSNKHFKEFCDYNTVHLHTRLLIRGPLYVIYKAHLLTQNIIILFVLYFNKISRKIKLCNLKLFKYNF